MRLMLDAAQLPAVIPPCDVLAGYITSPADAHTWTADEWARARAHAAGILPIHVAPANSNAVAGANAGHQSVNDAHGLGIQEGCAVCIDIEHAGAAHVVESGYAHAWVGVVGAAGFLPLVYASATDRKLVAPLGELWLADWTGHAGLIAGTVATQYANETPAGFDSSVLADTLRIAHTGTGGAPVGNNTKAPVVGIVAHPSGAGYWTFNDEGAVYAFGAAKYHGGANAPDVSKYVIVGMAATHTGDGYWLVAADGGVFSYGDAHFYGAVVGGVLKGA
jgi:hypothetical protein